MQTMSEQSTLRPKALVAIISHKTVTALKNPEPIYACQATSMTRPLLKLTCSVLLVMKDS